MLIFRFISLLWFTTGLGLQALVLKNHISFITLSSAAALYSPSLETLCFSSCLFKAPPPKYPVCSDWSAHTRLSQHR